MTSEFEEIAAGLEQAIAHAKGEPAEALNIRSRAWTLRRFVGRSECLNRSSQTRSVLVLRQFATGSKDADLLEDLRGFCCR